ncbi:MAG: cadherin-like domain-containing protein [Proteobacteria bacterium]|nr:cadherin-like domain-containing protein [Pseudomonadota bacterium]
MLSVIRACTRVGVVGGLLAVFSACGGGGGGSPNPVLGTLTFTTNENVALNGTLTATDPGGKAVTFATTSSPASGTLTGLPGTGAFTYTPNANFTGSDSFGVTATDAAGNASTGTVKITVTVDQPPTANNTVVRADGTALAKINVLTSASDPDKDTLTVTILTQPPAGAGVAAVNPDGTVNLSGLSSFKGVTHFTYRVTDPSGKTADAAAAVFVGTDPFRAAFVGDSAANGSNEVYLTDFAAAPVAMTAATQGNVRLQGFAIADNGSTVVYRTQDSTNAAATGLSFVRTASPTTATAISLPSGLVPVADANHKDQFVVSPDGNWVAVIAGSGQGGASSLYVVNVAQAGSVAQIFPSGTTSAALPTFSVDSKSIYFLAGVAADGTGRSLYFASLSSPSQTTLISAQSDPTSGEEINSFAVSPDQTRIVLEAKRSANGANGKVNVFFVDATHPGTETLISRPLAFGQLIQNTSVGFPANLGGSQTVSRVIYAVNAGTLDPVNNPAGVYVAEVSSSSNPRLAVQASGLQVLAIRPDDAALLYTDGATVTETVVDQPGSQALGGGNGAWYDSTGNIALLNQTISSYNVLASTSRGSFGMTNRVGTSSLAVIYKDLSGMSDGVAIIGQGPTSGTPPAAATLQLVNALAPGAVFPLASFQSPLQLSSYTSKVVSK